jgi:hypothetical protein|tara:strand:+ start:135 stop:491 length:357 start_codon:yes stop_codon:yes gene_type:complete
MTTTIFSNGHAHKYTGKRPVTAAWMVVTPSKEIVSGHSIDEKTAAKTARNVAVSRSGFDVLYPWRGAVTLFEMRLQEKDALNKGYKSHRDHVQAVRLDRAGFIEKCHIEILPVVRIKK